MSDEPKTDGRRRGSWLSTSLGSLLVAALIFGAYMGAYYSIATPTTLMRRHPSGGIGIEKHCVYASSYPKLAETIFGPAHQIDRHIRPATWRDSFEPNAK